MIKSLKLYDFDTEIKVLHLLGSSSSSPGYSPLMGMGWEVPSDPVLHPRLLFNPKLQAWQTQVRVPASYATLPRKQIIDQEWLKHSFFLTFLERVNSEKINLFINVQISINGLLGQMFLPEKGRGV